MRQARRAVAGLEQHSLREPGLGIPFDDLLRLFERPGFALLAAASSSGLRSITFESVISNNPAAFPAFRGRTAMLYAGCADASTASAFSLPRQSSLPQGADHSRGAFCMPNPTVHEALIYLMVVASASDRDMSDPELGLIGKVVRSGRSSRISIAIG
jgi:hypothetical protein